MYKIFQTRDSGLILTDDRGVILRSEDVVLVGKAYVNNSRSLRYELGYHLGCPLYGDLEEIILKQNYSDITIRFEKGNYVTDKDLATVVTSFAPTMTRRELWEKSSALNRRPFPHHNPIDIHGLSITEGIEKILTCISTYGSIDLDSYDFDTMERRFKIEGDRIYKWGKNNNVQSKKELYFYFQSANPLYVPIISAFMQDGILVIVQKYIRGRQLECGELLLPHFRKIFEEDFCWIHTSGIQMFDGHVLYRGSCDLIIEDDIPWIFDLGEIFESNLEYLPYCMVDVDGTIKTTSSSDCYRETNPIKDGGFLKVSSIFQNKANKTSYNN